MHNWSISTKSWIRPIFAKNGLDSANFNKNSQIRPSASLKFSRPAKSEFGQFLQNCPSIRPNGNPATALSVQQHWIFEPRISRDAFHFRAEVGGNMIEFWKTPDICNDKKQNLLCFINSRANLTHSLLKGMNINEK